jgi:hypothetical protein
MLHWNGYGKVYAIGVDQAIGDEMNRASKLCEDIDKESETLIKKRAYDLFKELKDCIFRKRIHEEVPFSFYEVYRSFE